MEKIDIIEQNINEIFNRFAFELNTEYTRNMMCEIISKYLDLEVLDRTTVEDIDNDKFYYTVNINNIEYPLMYYVKNKKVLDREYKLNKIMNKK